MAQSIANLCDLVVESRLLTANECRKHWTACKKANPAASENDAKVLARWLVAAGAVTRYHAKVLLAGRPGPFIYGDYLVFDRIEDGRLAGLFRACHLPTDHPVCLLFLAGPALADPQALLRVSQQAAAARAASQAHAHLVECYELVDLAAYKFIAVEALQGQTAQELLTARGRLAPARACRIIEHAARGLARLHEMRVVHGRVRPANLWVREHGETKLLAFPLVYDPLATEPPPPAPSEESYLSPEISSGAAAFSPHGDVYSLAVTLYHLLAAGLQNEYLDQIDPHKALQQLAPALPKGLADVVARLVHPDPQQRLHEATAVAEVLAPFAGPDPRPSPAAATAQAYRTWLDRAGTPPAPFNQSQPLINRPVAVSPRPTDELPLAAAPAFPPVVAHETASLARARRRQSSSQIAWSLASVALAALVVAGAAYLLMTADRPSETPAPSEGSLVVAGADSRPKPATGPAGQAGPATKLEDINGLDGEPIWQSPTAGEPLDLAWLPPGVQAVIALAPAQLVEHDEWTRLTDPRTLGPLSQAVLTDLPRQAGTSLDNIELVLMGLVDTGGPAPETTLVIRTVSPVPRQELLAAWGNPSAEQTGGRTIYVRDQRAYYIPGDPEDRLLVVAPRREIEAIVAAGRRAPALRRELEILLEASDRQRHFTLAFAPSFVFTGGTQAGGLAATPAARMADPLQDLLTFSDAERKPELPKAVMLSLHLDESFFLELVVYNSFAGRPSPMVARELRQRVSRLGRQASQYLRDLSLSAYSKEVLWDFPLRLDALGQYTRAGTNGKQVVLRAYLPALAAHNLALGGHLALLETPGATSAAGVVQSVPPAAQGLDKVTSLSFPSNTLQAAIELLSDDIGLEIVILGSDLEIEGITKNQSFALDEQGLPARAILGRILAKANPAGKLVYVSKPGQDGGPEVLYITTRSAAAKRGENLPPELQ
ncbi:MAG: protein kinase [Pirellulales bacterium]